MPFTSLHLAQPILLALQDEGYSTPTPIQAQAIPPIMEGRDVLGCAQTGTGKTAAFALPVLHRLHKAPVDKAHRGVHAPRALVLSPTRELATQIAESFATYGRHTGLAYAVIFGGVSQFHQVKALKRGVDILVATPGRLIDLMEQGYVDLSRIGILVLDEADRMLDMGFIQPIRRIVSALPRTDAEHPRQTLLFSATMPREIQHLADSLLVKPVKVSVTPVASAAPLIDQCVFMVPQVMKQSLLHRLLEEQDVARAVVFTRTKHSADKVAKKLNTAGITAVAIHGNKAQNQRTRALDAFRTGRMRVLVATDVAARGLDVDGITHVFNFDLPNEPEAYVHRIGRTGRAGAKGLAIAFCDGSERGFLKGIERLTGARIRQAATPADLAPPPASAPLDDRRTSIERLAQKAPNERDLRQKPRPRPSRGPASEHPGHRGQNDRPRDARRGAPEHRSPEGRPDRRPEGRPVRQPEPRADVRGETRPGPAPRHGSDHAPTPRPHHGGHRGKPRRR